MACVSRSHTQTRTHTQKLTHAGEHDADQDQIASKAATLLRQWGKLAPHHAPQPAHFSNVSPPNLCRRLPPPRRSGSPFPETPTVPPNFYRFSSFQSQLRFLSLSHFSPFLPPDPRHLFNSMLSSLSFYSSRARAAFLFLRVWPKATDRARPTQGTTTLSVAGWRKKYSACIHAHVLARVAVLPCLPLFCGRAKWRSVSQRRTSTVLLRAFYLFLNNLPCFIPQTSL